MPLVCSTSVRCHTSKEPSLRDRNESLDPVSECNAQPNAFATLKTVDFNCKHCLKHGHLAKDESSRESGDCWEDKILDVGWCLMDILVLP